MRLATLKEDLYFFRGGILPKGTTIQVGKREIITQPLYGYRLLAPGGLGSFVYEYALDNTVEFLDDETGHT